MKRIIGILCLLLVLWAVPAAAEIPAGIVEGQVTGHGAPEVWLFSAADRPTEDQLRTTALGLEFIKDHEGFSATGYSDNTQTSIGYGSSTAYAEKYGFSTTKLTRSEAHDLLVCVVYELEQKLDSFLASNGLTLEDHQYDALISFTYNLGAGWLGGCRLSRHLVDGYTVNEFASAMGIWCHVGSDIIQGLVDRRRDEIVLFLDGAYDSSLSDLEFCTLRYTGDGTFDNDIDFYEKGKPYGSFSQVWPTDTSKPYLAGWYTLGGARITEQTVVAVDLTVSPRWSDTEDTSGGYTIERLTALDEDGQTLETIPDGSFYLSAEIYKAEDTGASVVMLVTYTAEGKMLDTWFLQANVPPGTTYSLGTWVDNTLGRVGQAKAFLLPSLSDPTPLCEAAVLTK